MNFKKISIGVIACAIVGLAYHNVNAYKMQTQSVIKQQAQTIDMLFSMNTSLVKERDVLRETVNNLTDKHNALMQENEELKSRQITTINRGSRGNELGYFELTSYNSGSHGADGTPVYEGMIAVDPNVIPLGSSVYIEFPEPYTYMNGIYTAHDVGSAVTGNVIDVYMDVSDEESSAFGRRMARVYTLE